MTTIGILGGGQLARMLALAAHPLGIRTVAVDPVPDAPVAAVGHHVAAALDDERALDTFADQVDVVTVETENIPVATMEMLARKVRVAPSARSLEVSQDRLTEKEFLRSIEVPTAPYADVPEPGSLHAALETVGLPAIVKTRRFGYDGRGQYTVGSEADAREVASALGEGPHIAEGVVRFSQELSVVAVRAEDGDIRTYPPVRNVHRDGILRTTTVPTALPADAASQAEAYARRIVETLGHVGVLTVELFDVGGTILANEIAPRVHNSGHWTIEGAVTSQFENHVRAVAGLPLGETYVRGHNAMVNLIGRLPHPRDVLAVPGAHLHLYDKAPRAQRKLGHVTVSVADPDELRVRLDQLLAIVGD